MIGSRCALQVLACCRGICVKARIAVRLDVALMAGWIRYTKSATNGSTCSFATTNLTTAERKDFGYACEKWCIWTRTRRCIPVVDAECSDSYI
jgi:hypothetical protein